MGAVNTTGALPAPWAGLQLGPLPCATSVGHARHRGPPACSACPGRDGWLLSGHPLLAGMEVDLGLAGSVEVLEHGSCNLWMCWCFSEPVGSHSCRAAAQDN